jgi:hypothetical protein
MRWLVAVALAACATTHAPAAQAKRPVLVIRCAVADASVTIDGQLVGDVADLGGGVGVPPGLHRVELAADGYHTRYAEVTLALGERRELALTMVEALP